MAAEGGTAMGLPYRDLPAAASQARCLLHGLEIPVTGSTCSTLCGLQRRWLVAQCSFHAIGHTAFLLLLLCREQGKGNLVITATKSRKSRSATQEVSSGEVIALTQPAGSLSLPQAKKGSAVLDDIPVCHRAGKILQPCKDCRQEAALDDFRGYKKKSAFAYAGSWKVAVVLLSFYEPDLVISSSLEPSASFFFHR